MEMNEYVSARRRAKWVAEKKLRCEGAVKCSCFGGGGFTKDSLSGISKL